ncbi:ankyrin repeat-containing domain protein [Mycena latifolia]|nr:ankyrin repeat-containing domain protein [Mycena latifolia]
MSGSWLLQRPEYREWIYAPSSLLWLHGISGSGKTVLSSTTINVLRGRAEPLAFFYFDTNNPEQRTVTQFLCSLVTQLSVQARQPDKTLTALWTSHASGQHLPSDSALVSEALIPLLKGFTEPLYILLDALDECSERDLLLRLITEIVDLKLSNVHLLLTSRPEVPRGTHLVQRAVSVSLEGCVDHDIESYAMEILSNLKVQLTDDRKGEITRALLERGGGMFRLVSLQLDELRSCDWRESQVTKALSDMPTSLDAIYDRILQNIKNPEMMSCVGRAINWLIFSKRPMMLGEIIDALAFDFEKEPLRFNAAERMLPNALLDACAGFVTVSEDAERDTTTIKLAHASVKEYFFSAKQPRGNYSVSEQTAHHLIARTCIAYLSSFDRVVESDADLQQYPLTLYAGQYRLFHVTHDDGVRLWTYEPHYHTSVLFASFWLIWALSLPLTYLFYVISAIIPVRSQAQRRNTEVPHIVQHSSTSLQRELFKLFQLHNPPYTTLFRLYDVDNYTLGFTANRGLVPILPPLYLAVCVGIGHLVQEILERGGDANTQGGSYGNLLQAASHKGHIEIVRLLLDRGASVNAHGGKYRTPLRAASERGHIEIVRLLLKHGAKMNTRGRAYSEALEAACEQGHNEVARLLLEQGANVNAQDHYRDALQFASRGGHIKTVQLLLEQGANVNAEGGHYGDALQGACEEGNIEIVRLLLAKGANVNSQNGYYGNALQAAAFKSHKEIVRILLEQGADVNVEGGTYGTALQAASDGMPIAFAPSDTEMDGASYDNRMPRRRMELVRNEIVCLLLEHGANVNIRGGNYGTALQAASSRGPIEIVRLLLEKGADVNVQGGSYDNALQAASEGGNPDIVRVLLEGGANVNAKAGYHGNALHAACEYRHTEIARLLLEHGADPNALGGHYGNALQAVSSEPRMFAHPDANNQCRNEIVRLLLEHGAAVNTQGGHYGTVLQAACSKGDTDLVRLLLEKGADVNLCGGYYGNALQAASENGETEIVRLLLEGGADVHAQVGYHGSTLPFDYTAVARSMMLRSTVENEQGGHYGNALQAASSGGHTETVGLLVEKGADVNAQGGYHSNALQAASSGGHTEISRFLLDQGANVNAQGGIYGTALQAASWGGHTELVCLLLERGANVNAEAGIYGTALQAASHKGPTEKALLLLMGLDVNLLGVPYVNVPPSGQGHSEIICLLLERGAYVDAQCGIYGSALQAACSGGHANHVRLLLEKGADVNLQGGHYGSAQQAASKQRNTEILRLLREKNAAVTTRASVTK